MRVVSSRSELRTRELILKCGRIEHSIFADSDVWRAGATAVFGRSQFGYACDAANRLAAVLLEGLGTVRPLRPLRPAFPSARQSPDRCWPRVLQMGHRLRRAFRSCFFTHLK